jgi:Leucine-rich repeat (LRR) protein
LSYNRLTDASGALQPVGALIGLTSLNLATNPGLAGSTVVGLAPLTRLTFLSVNASGLVGTMDSLSALTRLTSLDLCVNSMTGTLSVVSGMTELVYLDVDKNQIAGTKSPY